MVQLLIRITVLLALLALVENSSAIGPPTIVADNAIRTSWVTCPADPAGEPTMYATVAGGLADPEVLLFCRDGDGELSLPLYLTFLRPGEEVPFRQPGQRHFICPTPNLVQQPAVMGAWRDHSPGGAVEVRCFPMNQLEAILKAGTWRDIVRAFLAALSHPLRIVYDGVEQLR